MLSCNMLVRGWGRVSLCEFLSSLLILLSLLPPPLLLLGRKSAVLFATQRAADSSHRILKRRLAWLIGEWVSSDEECAKLPLVWQILVHLLSERGESSDMAVRLTAAIAFKNCVDVRPPQD
jgi:hypothetical protein